MIHIKHLIKPFSSLFIVIMIVLVVGIKSAHAQNNNLAGDANKNGVVDIFDFNILVAGFSKAECNHAADIDANCRVDIFDFNILVANFGKNSSQSTPTAAQNKSDLLQSIGVIYNDDSSARISRNSAAKVQLPQQLLNPQQGWVAVRMKMGFDATTTLSPDPVIWDMSESDPSDLFVYFDVDTDTFHFVRRRQRSGKTVSSSKQFFTQGSFKTIIAAWENGLIKVSTDGEPFVTTTTGAGDIPAQAPFLIGSTLVQGQGRQPNSDYYWVVAGTETLSNIDANKIHTIGNSDLSLNDFSRTPVFFWPAVSNTYFYQ